MKHHFSVKTWLVRRYVENVLAELTSSRSSEMAIIDKEEMICAAVRRYR